MKYNTNSIEATLKANMDKVNELINQSETMDFSYNDGLVTFTGFVGKKGSRAKASCAYVKVYLQQNPIAGITYQGIPSITESGKPYTQDAWKVKEKDAVDVCNLFNEIAKIGRKIYKESSK